MKDGGFEFPEESRFAQVAKLDRRRFLRTASMAGLAAALAACTNDADVFADGLDLSADGTVAENTQGAAASSSADAPALRVGEAASMEQSSTTASSLSVDSSTGESTGSSTTSATDSAGQTTSSQTAPSTSASNPTTSTSAPQSTTATTQPTTQTTSGGSTTALPSGATMSIAFTYEQQSGGKNVPPYIAVWIEDSGGNLVQTVELWYQQFGRGERWLPDLRRWYSVDQQRLANGGSDTVAAISGPTRSPGRFQVGWDGRANGSPVAPGTYYVCIESARERGPYSLIRRSINLSGTSTQADLGRDGELVDASASVAA